MQNSKPCLGGPEPWPWPCQCPNHLPASLAWPNSTCGPCPGLAAPWGIRERSVLLHQMAGGSGQASTASRSPLTLPGICPHPRPRASEGGCVHGSRGWSWGPTEAGGMGWWQAEQEEPVPVHCERSLSMMQEKEEPPPLSPDGMGGGRQEARWQDPKFQPDWPLGSFPGVWVDGLRAPDTLRSWLSQHCAGRDCSGSNPFTGFSVQYPIHCTHTPNLPWGSLVPAWPASWNSAQTNTFGDSLQGFKERLPTASKEDVPAPSPGPCRGCRRATASPYPLSQPLAFTTQTSHPGRELGVTPCLKVRVKVKSLRR